MNEAQIRLAIDLIKSNGLVEVRIIGDKTYSGYFKNVDNLIKQVSSYEKDNIYFVMNEINEACYDRKQQESIQLAKNTTSDNDIVARRWLLIDIDSKRSTGVGATEEEKEHSRQVGHRVFKFLRDVGFSEPISADSGNGFHLLYPISLANTTENSNLIRNVLLVLDMYFSNDNAQIDTSVFNASRITKLYGTTARKGRNTKDRPHRESRIVKAPKDIRTTDISLLKRVSDMLPAPEEKTRWNNYGHDSFDLDNFIQKYSIKTRSVSKYAGGTKYVLEHCLFDHSHTGKDAAIFKLDSGAIGYKCFHNSCSDRKWQDVRRMFEPTAYDRKDYSFNTVPQQPKKPQEKQDDKGNKFLQLHEIKTVDKSSLVYMQSHFTELDKKIIGFLKGEVSVWSGLNSSGKSSVLGQLCLQAVNDGFKALMYSGELLPHRVKNWLHLQAAGRQFTQPTDYGNYFFVPKKTSELIDIWLKDKFFLYNNNYGSEYNQLITDISDRLKKGDLDMIVLDNIMTLELEELASDSNTRQKKAIKTICDLAKEYNVHIHIVAHPRKSKGFLRKDDISGSGDISNLVDNVLIVHRVNNDFIRYTNEYFGNGEAAYLHKYNNVIEVCKNRDLGVQDYMVGTYFEIESKRFLNYAFDNIIYGWQDIELQGRIQYEPIRKNDNFLNEKNDDLPFTPIIDPLPF